MKLLFLLTVIVVAVSCVEDKINLFATNMADFTTLTEEEVNTCITKTSLTVDDLEHVVEVVNSDVLPTDFDDKSLKVGCFMACAAEKKGLIPLTETNMNDKIEDLKTVLQEKMQLGRRTGTDSLSMGIPEIVGTCSDQAKGETDDCKMTLKFFQCYITEYDKAARESKLL